MSEFDANIFVDGQKTVATIPLDGGIVKDGGELDATCIVEDSNGKRHKAVKIVNVDDEPTIKSEINAQILNNNNELITVTEEQEGEIIPQNDSQIDFHCLVQKDEGEQLSVKTVELDGEIIKTGGAIDTSCIVQGSNGKKQLAVKVFKRGGGEIIDTVSGNGSITLPKAKANGLKSVKLFGGTEQRNLPAEYTQVESLTNTSGAYIATSISLDDNDEIEFWWNAEASGSIFAFSQGASADNQAFQLANTSDNGIVFDIQNYNPYRVITNVQAYNNGVKHIVIKNREIFIDGVSYGTSTGSLTSPTDTLSLFISSASVTSVSKFTNRFTVKNKINLIPCRRNSDNVLGMYDTVSGTFLTNKGTGDFVAGPTAVPTPDAPMDIVSNNGALKVRHASGLPLGYQMVEWLKPTDAIQITGFKTKSTQEITAVFYRESSASSYLYWSDTVSSGTTNTTAYLTTSSGNWRWDGKTYSISVSSGIKITSVQNKDGVWLNGTKYGYYTDADEFVSTNDLSLASYTNTSVRIYSMTIREGDTVTLDLVPVQRLSDSSYGFYDKVSGEFYTNAEATFVAGDVIDDPVGIYTDGTVETVEVSKNYFTREGETVGQIIGSDGTVSNNANYCISAIINLPVGEYKCKWDQGVSTSRPFSIYKCDSNGNIIATKNGGQLLYSISGIGSGSFSIDTNTIVRISYRTNITENSYVMLSLGTATAEMLLSVSDYKDVQSVLDGEVTRNVGVKVLDGTENWTKGTASSLNYYYGGDTNLNSTAENELICNQFDVGARNTPVVGKICVRQSRNGFLITPNDQTLNTTAAFKQWLADQYANGTPVIVVYPLATPTTETVTPQTLQTQAGTNILQITQASIDNLPLEATYKRGK